MYSLRSATGNCIVYEVDARDFVTHIKSINKERDFKRWQKKRDQIDINKLAQNLAATFKGMNIDGASNDVHV